MVVVDERALRRRCKRELRALGLQPPLRVELLCQRLGERRQRPIRLVPYALPASGPFGLWIGTETADYIFYQINTTRIHQDHIILHEVGHIFAGHDKDDIDQHLQSAMPDISPETIRRALQRTYYDTTEEREAEMFATIIMDLMGRAPAMYHANQEKSSDPVVKRIHATLSDQWDRL